MLSIWTTGTLKCYRLAKSKVSLQGKKSSMPEKILDA